MRYLIMIGIFFFIVIGVGSYSYNLGIKDTESKYNKQAIHIAETSKHNTIDLNKEIVELKKKLKEKKHEVNCADILSLNISHCLPK